MPASKGTKKKSSAPARGGKKAQKPIRREVGAVVCLLLALLGFLGFVPVKAIFIDFFCGIQKGLLGYGFYLFSPMLLVASAILGFHRGRPVRLRMALALLIPLPVSAFIHLVFCKTAFAWSWAMIPALYKAGMADGCGGVLGGLFSIAFSQIFSKVGAGIFFVLGLLVMVIVAFNVSVVDIWDRIRNRPPRLEYEPEAPEPVRQPQPAPVPIRRVGRQIDIPIDEKTPGVAAPAFAPAEPEKKGLFNKRPGVKTPDEILSTAATAPAMGTVRQAAPPEAPEIVREPAVVKVKPEEVQKEADGIGKSIEKTLESVPSYRYPPVSLLDFGLEEGNVDGSQEIQANKGRLEDTIHSFGIDANVIHVVHGPTVTRFELELDRGVKLNKLTNLADDIALSLGVSGVRIAPIPDKISVVGIEVPNRMVSTVFARDVIDSPEFRNHRSKIAFALGRDIAGSNIVGDISKLPHLLIAGTTGSGKSVCMNTIIISLLYKATPEEVRLIMIDPKMIELGVYNGIPHLLIPVVTDPEKGGRRPPVGGDRNDEALPPVFRAGRAGHRVL